MKVWVKIQVWLKIACFGVVCGAVAGFLWASGLWDLWMVLSKPNSVTARHWRQEQHGEVASGYIHRLWTCALYGAAAGIPLALLLALNKDWRYFITKSDPNEDEELTDTAVDGKVADPGSR